MEKMRNKRNSKELSLVGFYHKIWNGIGLYYKFKIKME